jgi:hypothetical protein
MMDVTPAGRVVFRFTEFEAPESKPSSWGAALVVSLQKA